MPQSIVNSCIVCQSQRSKEVIRPIDHLVSQELFAIHQCIDCGFRFIKNPPPESEAHLYYESEEYVEHSDSSEGIINAIYHKARDLMIRYKYRLIKKYGLDKRMLDFGTGTGYFLNYMKSCGYDVCGVEISDKARAFGQQHFGLDFHHPKHIFDSDFPGGFSYVTFWHVLEHVYNPQEVLVRLRELMTHDGIMIVALPNHKCLEEKYYKQYWCGYDVPRHLWHWDSSSFERFANMCGFEITSKKMLPLDPFYNCLISEGYRGKKWANMLIPLIGLSSFLWGWMSNDKASSIVYFLSKSDSHV